MPDTFNGILYWIEKTNQFHLLDYNATARPGDWVAVELPVEGGDARIRAVLPRFSRFSRRAAFLDLDHDFALVPGLDFDRAVERGEPDVRRPWDREALLLAHDLPLRIDADDAAGPEGGGGDE